MMRASPIPNFAPDGINERHTHDPTHWNVVFEKLRAYADGRPNIRCLLITRHTIKG